MTRTTAIVLALLAFGIAAPASAARNKVKVVDQRSTAAKRPSVAPAPDSKPVVVKTRRHGSPRANGSR
jgi:hypothetical protein